MPKRARSHGKVKRMAESKDTPQVFEEAKGLMCIRGTKTTDELRCVLRDIAVLTKPHSKTFMRRNLIRPFEDAEPLEFLCTKNGMGMFVLASHSKKRPFNLTIGRCFGGKMLDMVEFGITGVSALSMARTPPAMAAAAKESADEEDVEEDEDAGSDEADTDAGGSSDAASRRAAAASAEEPKAAPRAPTPQIGMRPCMIFVGSGWEADARLSSTRSLLLDTFRGVPTRPGDGVLLTSVSWCICVTQTGADSISLRSYTTELRRSGIRTPKVVVRDMGFHIDATIRRHQAPEPAMLKEATRIPPQAHPARKKNIHKDAVGDTYGRVHMERQDFGALKLRATKAGKADRRVRRAEPAAEDAPEDAGAVRAKRSRAADE